MTAMEAVLAVLRESREPVTPRQLVGRVKHSRTSVHRALHRLEQARQARVLTFGPRGVTAWVVEPS